LRGRGSFCSSEKRGRASFCSSGSLTCHHGACGHFSYGASSRACTPYAKTRFSAVIRKAVGAFHITVPLRYSAVAAPFGRIAALCAMLLRELSRSVKPCASIDVTLSGSQRLRLSLGFSGTSAALRFLGVTFAHG
jgi:hypothetical protein